MSEVFYQQQPTATWNPVRGVWEKQGMANLLCEHWALFSEVWPTSGMMRNGQVYEQQMQVRHTTDSESSLLRSPKASEGQGGALGEAEALRRGNTVGVRDQVMDLVASQGKKVSRVLPNPTVADQFTANLASTQQKEGSLHSVSLAQIVNRPDLLPTPAVAHLRNHDEDIDGYLQRRKDYEEGKTKGMPGASLGVAVRMETLPTPTTRDYKDGSEPHERDGIVQTDTVARAIFNSGEVLLPTTRTSMKNGATAKEVEAGNPKSRIETEVLLDATNWGKFAPAIARWEETLGLPAPAPTKPDGKDGAHRLSSEFTEWMMGLPAGWITDCGLTRNEELKAAGNGVVPQQAELALRILLSDVVLE